MDKREQIARMAQNKDDEILLAKLYERMTMAQARNIPAVSGFLSKREQMLAQELLRGQEICFFGGPELAEREICCYLPDYLDSSWLTGDDGPIAAVRAVYFAGDTLTHRDFLGSLMAQGITREKLGDILVSEGSCDLIVSRDIAPYLLQNVTSAGRVKLSVSEIGLSDLNIPELKVKEIRDTVSTLRLDAVAASGFSMSRGKAQELISSGRVQLNHRETLKADAPVVQGDVISARGLGKFEVAEVGGLSKKGRTALLLRRYL